MSTTTELRPVERRVLALTEAGLDDAEIARRFKRGERWVAQVRRLAELERPPSTPEPEDDPLRPLERRVLRWRRRGADHEELARRFRRSPEHMARIEEYANYKLAEAA